VSNACTSTSTLIYKTLIRKDKPDHDDYDTRPHIVHVCILLYTHTPCQQFLSFDFYAHSHTQDDHTDGTGAHNYDSVDAMNADFVAMERRLLATAVGPGKHEIVRDFFDRKRETMLRKQEAASAQRECEIDSLRAAATAAAVAAEQHTAELTAVRNKMRAAASASAANAKSASASHDVEISRMRERCRQLETAVADGERQNARLNARARAEEDERHVGSVTFLLTSIISCTCTCFVLSLTPPPFFLLILY
jgi:hypothetical protein